tara:strand:+ start:142 stop:477 length:336 start_codon:yes stop_codon:yes gene_type:complete
MNSEYMRKMEYMLNHKNAQIRQLQQCIFQIKDDYIRNNEDVVKFKKIADTANKNLEDVRLKFQCLVCYDNLKSVVLEPCLHLVTCRKCSEKLETCPICRSSIETMLLVFGN